MKNSMFLILLLAAIAAKSQVKIGDNPNTISPGSILELESTSKALTLPRMTTLEMQAIPDPLPGMIVFNTDSNCIYLYKNENAWASIIAGTTPANKWPYHSDDKVIGTEGNAKGIISLTGSGLAATGNYSHAEGVNSLASGDHSLSAGYADTATHIASIAIGYENKAAGNYSFTTGYKNIAASQSSVALGQENYDSGWASMTMGLQNRIFNNVNYSNTLGYNNRIQGGWSNITMGENNTVLSGRANMAMGLSNTTDGNYNSLSGKSNEVQAGNSNVTGGEMNIIKTGSSNTLFGFNNSADGNYLSAFGKDNSVYYQSAVAFGQGNKDSGWASVAGGLNNIIEPNVPYSTIFGINNLATKNSALLVATPGAATFSAGSANYNSGYGSLAFGGNNRSSGIFSLAANYSSLSNGFAMSSFGHFNDTLAAYPGQNFNAGEMIFSIGNGTNDNNRRNSFTMLRNGFTTINGSGEPGPNVPRAELDVKGTGAIVIPVGTTAQRPVTPVAGMIRFCTDCDGGPVLQGYDGTAWVNL